MGTLEMGLADDGCFIAFHRVVFCGGFRCGLLCVTGESCCGQPSSRVVGWEDTLGTPRRVGWCDGMIVEIVAFERIRFATASFQYLPHLTEHFTCVCHLLLIVSEMITLMTDVYMICMYSGKGGCDACGHVD